ncbi:MAG: cupin domain-containing protein [Verrucomicrobiota bacterium]
MQNFELTQMESLGAVACPCGFARRAFAHSGSVASLHITDIQADSRTHYHKRMTELYLVLEGEGQMELDGQLYPLKPMTAIYIKPGCRHRAIGRLRVNIVAIPAFDKNDEWFD